MLFVFITLLLSFLHITNAIIIPNGSYKVTNRNNGLVMAMDDSMDDNPTQVVFNYMAWEKYIFVRQEESNYYHIRNQISDPDMCLTISSTTTTNSIITEEPCNNDNDEQQLFYLVEQMADDGMETSRKYYQIISKSGQCLIPSESTTTTDPDAYYITSSSTCTGNTLLQSLWSLTRMGDPCFFNENPCQNLSTCNDKRIVFTRPTRLDDGIPIASSGITKTLRNMNAKQFCIEEGYYDVSKYDDDDDECTTIDNVAVWDEELKSWITLTTTTGLCYKTFTSITCIPNIGEEYTCTCAQGWFGETCTDGICSPNPCQNDGVCVPGVVVNMNANEYECWCDTGYDGINCEINIQVTTPDVSNQCPYNITFLCWLFCDILGFLGLC